MSQRRAIRPKKAISKEPLTLPPDLDKLESKEDTLGILEYILADLEFTRHEMYAAIVDVETQGTESAENACKNSYKAREIVLHRQKLCALKRWLNFQEKKLHESK